MYVYKVKSLSRVRLFVTPWTVAYQAPPSMGFSRQDCWSGLPFPSPGDLPDPGIEPGSPTLQADALLSEPVFINWFLHFLHFVWSSLLSLFWILFQVVCLFPLHLFGLLCSSLFLHFCSISVPSHYIYVFNLLCLRSPFPRGFPGGSEGRRLRFDPWFGKIPRRRK